VPALIVVNGAPGSGKSTVAQRYVAAHPLALNLEIDRIRRRLGAWKDDPATAGQLARTIALVAARAHLGSGHDVVLPQYLGRVDYLHQLEAVAAETGASHHEIVLMDTKDNLAARFLARSRAAADPTHVEAQEQLERNGGPRQLEAMYDRLLLVIAARPQAKIVTAREGAFDEAYAAFEAALTAGSGSPSPAR
jgi:predicted kinase